jgi:HK97 gp10 family phage protein
MKTINVKGLADLQKFLDQLPAKMEANVIRGALRAGMKVVKNKAAINIDSQSGELASGLRIYTRLRDGVVRSVLATSGYHGYIAMWVEYGTRPHLIKVRDDEKKINYRLSRKRGEKVLESMTTINRRVLQIGNNFVGPVISHPGAKPHPFLRPALDSEGQKAVIAAAEYIKMRLGKKHGLDTSDVVFEAEA